MVESPAKARTLQSYLGKGYRVLACNGHVRDLKQGGLSIDTKKGFEMQFEPVESSKAAVNSIRAALKKMPALYLATDPDREGEAIAWHLLELLSEKGALKGKQVHRVAFNQITRRAVTAAVEAPRDVAMPLVEAQKARRCMDRLLGFTLSPLLSRTLTRGLSAGRVQSPTLRLIVEREKEIEAFKPREYWTVTAHMQKAGQDFEAPLVELGGNKLKKFSLGDAAQTEKARDTLLAAHAQQREQQPNGRRRRREDHPDPGEAQPAPAVHHLNPAAGGLTPIGNANAKNHARGANPV